MTLNFRPFEELDSDSFASPFDQQRTQQTQPQAEGEEGQEQGSSNVLVDILRGVGNGIGNAADATIELTGFEVGLDDVFGETQTTVGSIAQGISQFATGFIPVVGVLGKVGRLGTIARGAVAGAITDFTVFDGQEERLSNLVQENPVLANPVTEFLAADGDDSEALGRLKNVMEGAALGAVFDTFALGLKQLKVARQARAEGLEPGAVVERVRQTSDPEDVVEPVPEVPDTPEPVALPEGTLPQLDNEDLLRNFIQQVDDVRQGSLAGEFDLTAHPRSSQLTGEEATAVGLDPNKYSIIEAFGDHDAEAVAFTIREKLTPLVREEVDRRRQEIIAEGGIAEDLIEEEIDRYRRARGDATREETIASLEGFAGDIQGVRADQEALEVRIRTQRVMLAAAQRDFAEFHTRVFQSIQEGTDSPALLAEYARNKRALEVATFELSGTKSSVGRNLRQLRDVPAYVGGPNGGAALEAYNRVINGAGGEAALKREIVALGEDMAEHGSEILGERILKRKAVGGAVLEYWMNSILSGLKTLNINAISGAAVTLYRPLEGMVGAGAKSLFSGDFTPVAEYARTYMDLLDSTRDAWKYSKQSFGSFLEDGENILIPDSRTFQDGEARQAISAEAFGKADDSPVGKFLNTVGPIVRLPSRSLQTTDEFWKQVNARSIVRRKLRKEGMDKGLQGDQLAAHIEDGLDAVIQDGELFTVQKLQKQAFAQAKSELPTGTPAQIRERTRELYADLWESEGKFAQPLADAAREYAEDVTFTKSLQPNSLSKGIQDLVVSHPVLRFVLPFVRTPVNILSFAAQRGANPIATARTIGDLIAEHTVAKSYPRIREYQGKWAREILSENPEVAAEARGRMTMAAGTTFTVLAAAAEGRITGRGPADKEQRRLLEAAGWQPYSIRVGDTYVSYNRLDPFATMIGVFADMAEYGRWTDVSDQGELQRGTFATLAALAQNFTNKSYVSGIRSFLDILADPEKNIGTEASRLGASFLPNVVGQTTGATDPYARELRSFWDTAMNRVPFLSENLDPVRNILGEPVQRTQSLGGETIPLANAFLPIAARSTKDKKLATELATLAWPFNPPPKKKQGQDLTQVALSSGHSAYDRWQELTGQVRIGRSTLKSSLKRLIASERYQRLPAESEPGNPSPRVELIRSEIRRFRNRAWRELLKEVPELRQATNQFERGRELRRRGVQVPLGV